MSAEPVQFKLLFRGNTVWLPPGQLFVGRSCACHIVVDDPLVSRRHAQLTVTTRHVTIEDLNSINGVFINGERLLEEPRALRDGDRIQMGSEELVFGSGTAETVLHPLGTATVSGIDPVVPADDDLADPSSYDAEDTCRVDGMRLLGEAAEQLLTNYLSDVLNSALAGKSLLHETYQDALHYGLKLAWATRNGAWFDYVIELLHARRTPPPAEYLESLYATLQRVGVVDLARLKRYVAVLPSAIPNPDAHQQQLMAHASALLEAAIHKQGT
jgi:hypothetical protein